MAFEHAAGRHVTDVHTQNLGYDLTSVDPVSGELLLIEVKGLAGADGSVMLTPNEVRAAHDRRDCYWLYVVSNCRSTPDVKPIKDPAQFPWQEVLKVAHYALPLHQVAGRGDQR